MAKRLCPFLRQAFRALKLENSCAYERITTEASPCNISIQNGTEQFSMAFTENAVVFSKCKDADVTLRLRQEVVDQLLNNETSLLTALRQNQIIATGSIVALTRLNTGFELFIRGAVRCPSLPELLNDYKKQGTGGIKSEAI